MHIQVYFAQLTTTGSNFFKYIYIFLSLYVKRYIFCSKWNFLEFSQTWFDFHKYYFNRRWFSRPSFAIFHILFAGPEWPPSAGVFFREMKTALPRFFAFLTNSMNLRSRSRLVKHTRPDFQWIVEKNWRERERAIEINQHGVSGCFSNLFPTLSIDNDVSFVRHRILIFPASRKQKFQRTNVSIKN
mgnify:CR=1 FL=1